MAQLMDTICTTDPSSRLMEGGLVQTRNTEKTEERVYNECKKYIDGNIRTNIGRETISQWLHEHYLRRSRTQGCARSDDLPHMMNCDVIDGLQTLSGGMLSRHESVTLMETIGNGVYGQIWKTNKKYLVKTSVCMAGSDSTHELGIHLLLACRYPTIVPKIHFVGEYREGGERISVIGMDKVGDTPITLCEYIRQRMPGHGAVLTPNGLSEIFFVLQRVCGKLERLQSDLGFMHRDLHCANIVIDEEHEPFLIDFGQACHKNRNCPGDDRLYRGRFVYNASRDLAILILSILGPGTETSIGAFHDHKPHLQPFPLSIWHRFLWTLLSPILRNDNRIQVAYDGHVRSTTPMMELHYPLYESNNTDYETTPRAVSRVIRRFTKELNNQWGRKMHASGKSFFTSLD